MISGFVLHPTYYIEKGRPVVHLFGRLENGETFVVRDDRARPEFFLRTRELPAAARVAQFRWEPSAFTDLEGEPVSRVVVAVPPEVPPLRDLLEESGIPTYEADIPFATRFLMDRGVRGAVSVDGEARPGRLIDRIFVNPTLTPADLAPELSVLSLDIETDPEARRIYSVALWGDDTREILVVANEAMERAGRPMGAEDLAAATGPEGTVVRLCSSEEELLRTFHQRVRDIDPDLLTGWNVIDFDLRVLTDRFATHRIPFEIGRAEIPCRLLLDRSSWGGSRAVVPGRAVLDGLNLLRGAFVRLEDYRLETAAREILGEGKTISAEDRGEEIARLYREDLPSFLRYNLNDARLVLEILDRRQLVELTVRRSLVTGMPPDRVHASIASFDFLYLGELHRRGMVAPTVRSDQPAAFTQGGFVLPSIPGIYENVAVLDYRSLYPSLIRTFRLDPISLIRKGADPPPGDSPDSESAIVAPNGARFRRDAGILPEILDRLFPLRQAALDAGDTLTATALKILMNSFYGVLATPRCRFYSPETANAITGFGQQTLHWTREAVERKGHRVLYGDTDSIFVETGTPVAQDAEAIGRRLAEDIDAALTARLRKEHGVDSRLHLHFDRLFRKLLLPALRGSREGSKKRYAGLVGDAPHERLVFVGLESVRRDWTDLAKVFQHELVRRVFQREPVEGFVREFIERLRQGQMDDLLVYRKALRKPEETYTRSTPPHVQAARRASRPPSRIVRYVVTTAGPEPADERAHPVDREHYVERQVRPVAEAVLSLVGLDWEGISGGQGQLF